jgi:prolyl 4-hydroxylase
MHLNTNYPLDVQFRYDEHPLIWELDNIYSREECDSFIQLIESNRPKIATNNPAYRNQDRVMIDDPVAADDLFERIKHSLPEKIGEFELLGVNERLRFYRYSRGQNFSPHMDHWHQSGDNEISLLTILVYLNSEFEGGETRFMEQIDAIVIPEPGKVAIFQHKIRHEGCEVLSGLKYAFRTDVMYKKT